MPSGSYSVALQIAGLSLTRSVSVNADAAKIFGDASSPIALPPANAIAGANYTNNGDGTATAILAEGHNLVDGKADLYWAGGVRYGCTVDVTGTSVSISGGAGDALPASATACTIANQVQVNAAIDGDEVLLVGIGSPKRAHVDLQDASGATVKQTELKPGEPFTWDASSATPNPLTGNPITKALASNGDSAAASTLQILVLEDSTPAD
jgi:hypothetical protein